jgi:hypothetical protein
MPEEYETLAGEQGKSYSATSAAAAAAAAAAIYITY